MSENPTPQVDMRDISFLKPAGEPAMLSPDSVSWQVFKNPVAMFIGGITATLLELAEPRIRAGVWDNTEFKDKPLPRLKRTGLAAMVTVFGAESTARRLIHGVNQRHAKIRGTTEDGVRYHASQRELMNWVHTTASFGFLEAYRAFVREVPSADRDRFYSEALNSASVYGAPGCPSSEAECKEHFAAISDQLQATEVNREFLDIMRRTPALPGIMRPFQGLFIRAAVSLLPPPLLTQLELEDMGRLRPWERWLVTLFGKLTDRMVIKNSPAVQSCQRLGLPSDYLYQKSRRLGTQPRRRPCDVWCIIRGLPQWFSPARNAAMALTALQAYNLEKALGRGQLVEAIKLYREATGCDLTTAKIEVDKFAADLKKRKPWLFKDQAMPESSGVDASGAIRKSRFNPKALLLFFLVDGLIFAGIIYYFVFYQPEQRAERRAERASSTAVQTSSGNQGRPASQRLIPPTSPDQYTATISDADSFASLYRQKIQSRDYIARKSASSSRRYDDNELERKIKSARSELAKMRPLPDNQSAAYIPLTEGQPIIDGILKTSEWQDAIVLTVDEELGTDLYLQTDGQWLFIACDARSEKTPGGYDQLRVYFHAGLLENLVNERIHIGRSGGVTSIRQTRFRWQGEPPKNDDERWKKYNISDWGLYQYAVGTSSMSTGHRQYEAAIHLGEAGLHAGAPFTFYIEVETDPLRNDAGKFVERRYLGHYGSEAQPKWLVF